MNRQKFYLFFLLLFSAMIFAENPPTEITEIEDMLGLEDPEITLKKKKILEKKRLEELLPSNMNSNDKQEKDSIGMTGTKKRVFFYYPNAISLRPVSNKSLETEGTPSASDWKKDKTPKRSFSPFSFITISHIHYLKRSWTWGVYYSPSINYFSWKIPGKIKMLHFTYNAKALLNLKDNWGTLKAAAGVGPLWMDGHYFGVHEEDKWVVAPRWQISYYKFLGDRFFAQIKYTKHNLLKKQFVSDNFAIESFSVTGLYFGWYFGKK